MRSLLYLVVLLTVAACNTANYDEMCRYYGNCEEEKSAECSMWGNCDEEKEPECTVWGNCEEEKEPQCSVWGNCDDDAKEDNGCTIYGCPDDKKTNSLGW